MANWRPLVYIAAGNKATDDPYTWVDYTRYLRDDRGTPISTQRGRQDETQHHNNGTVSIVLDNRDRTFVRDNNAWVQSDTPVEYLLEYPWLPGRLANGGFEQGWTKWDVEFGSPDVGVVTSISEAADAGGHFFLGSFATDEGIKASPCDLTGVGDSGSEMALTFRGVTRTPGTQLRARIAWFSDAACTILLGYTYLTAPVDYFLDVEPATDDIYTDYYFDVYFGTEMVFKWKRYGGMVVVPGGTNGAIVSITNIATNRDVVALDSVVFDTASFQGIEPQYTGYANSWDRTWEVGDAICNLACDDGFKALGKTKFSSKTYSQFILKGGDFSTGIIDEASISRIPDHYFQLNEPGGNNQATNFKDSITGDTRSASEIGKGVGSLYQVAGLVPTDAAFAWSSLGPSSADAGWISLPADFALGAQGSNWAAATWVRSINGTGLSFIFMQGVFNTLGGIPRPVSADGCILWLRSMSFIIGDTDQNLTFWSWTGFDPDTNTYTGSTNLVAAEIHNAHGYNFFDQAPHFVGVIVDGTHIKLFFDGVKVFDGSSGTPTQPQATQPLYLGKGTGFYSQVGDSVWSESLEYQHFMEWVGGVPPTDADMQTLYNRAITMYPQEDSGSRLQHVLDIVHWPRTLRNIDVGSSQVEKVTAPFADEAAHSYNQKIEDAEQGWMFIARDGRFRWKNRQSFFKNRTSLATFGTGAGEIPYSDVTIIDEDSILYNQAITSRTNSARLHQADDFPSQDQHFISTLERTDLLLVSEEETEAAAETIIDKYAEQKEMLTKLVLEATAGHAVNADVVMQQIMQRDIGDRITVRTREPGQIGYKEWIGIIQGISHTASRGKLTCTWDVTTLAVRDYFLFGDVFGSHPMGW